jgi:hypothetical protein
MPDRQEASTPDNLKARSWERPEEKTWRDTTTTSGWHM